MKNFIQFLRSVSFRYKDQRLFPHLKSWQPSPSSVSTIALLKKIKNPADLHTPFMKGESEKNTSIPAGYTYLGQFIAHDLTFSVSSNSDLSRPRKNTNLRTPQLDLDSLYGKGPLGDPVFFDQSRFGGRTHFRIGNETHLQICENDNGTKEHFILRDLYRLRERQPTTELPLIPDIRNDDNIIVSQLHLVFQLFHNKYVDQLIEKYNIVELLQSWEKLTLFSDREALPEVFEILDKQNSKHGFSVEMGDDFTEEKLTRLLGEKVNEFSDKKERSFEKLELAWNKKDPLFPFQMEAFSARSLSSSALFEENEFDAKLKKFDILERESYDEFLNTVLKSNTFKNFRKPFPSSRESVRALTVIEIPTNEFFDLIAALKEELQDLYVEIHSLIDLLLDLLFKNARETVTRSYHQIIFYDYLPKIIDKKVWADITSSLRSKGDPKLKRVFYKKRKVRFLPLEFSVAFFRFGHSMVRDRYIFFKKRENEELWKKISSITLFQIKSPKTSVQAFLDWRLFFFTDNDKKSNRTLLFSGKIEPLISESMLNNLGRTDRSSKNIVFRNLERSRRVGLPSGQSVATWFWMLGLIKYSEIIHSGKIQPYDDVFNISNFFPAFEGYSFKNFCDYSPLWFYILLEAYYLNKGNQLGPVAGRIVGEVLAGIIEDAPKSILKEKEIDFELAKKEYTPKKPSDIYSMIQLLKYIDVYDGKKKKPEPDQD